MYLMDQEPSCHKEFLFILLPSSFCLSVRVIHTDDTDFVLKTRTGNRAAG